MAPFSPPNYISAQAVHGDLYLGIIMVMMTKCLPYKQSLYTGGFLETPYSCNNSESNDAATQPQLLGYFTAENPTLLLIHTNLYLWRYKKNQGDKFPHSIPLVRGVTSAQYWLDMVVQNTKPHKCIMSYSIQNAGTFPDKTELHSQWEL